MAIPAGQLQSIINHQEEEEEEEEEKDKRGGGWEGERGRGRRNKQEQAQEEKGACGARVWNAHETLVSSRVRMEMDASRQSPPRPCCAFLCC